MNRNFDVVIGDPRHCPVHPFVRTSSPDGMFDAPCGVCEFLQFEDEEKWQQDPSNPKRRYCGPVRRLEPYPRRGLFTCEPDPLLF